MISVIKNISIVLVVIGLIYVGTVYSSPLRDSIMKTKEAVAGMNTSEEFRTQSLPDELQDDINMKVGNAKERVLDIKVGEIFSFFGRAGKIIDDVHVLQEEVKEKVQENTK